MSHFLRKAVSQNKRRHVSDSFNLDLTYVQPNLITMGYPSFGLESLYRNPYSQVRCFLDSYHRDSYRIYNLCAERAYKYQHSLFDNRVAEYPFFDHEPPSFPLIFQWCQDLLSWLEDPSHVAVVHCKAGKGRTGVCAATYLLAANKAATADEAMNIFGNRRTMDGKGLTIPSQRRYVHYFDYYKRAEMVLKSPTPGPKFSPENSPQILVTGIKLNYAPNIQSGCRLYYEIVSNKQVLFSSKSIFKPKWHEEGDVLELPGCPLLLSGDFIIYIYHAKTFKRKKFGRICLNSLFLPKNGTLSFTKFEIDGLHKDKEHKKVAPHFLLTCSFFSVDDLLSVHDVLSLNSSENNINSSSWTGLDDVDCNYEKEEGNNEESV
ncbi:hypothetical protein RCL1_005168 [Eukaryota sp. TZLM3-RCL]